jgi:hypothetical protein
MSRILPSSLLLALLLSACTTPHSDPTFVAPDGQSRLVRRIRGEIHDLERSTGRRFRGDTIEIFQPEKARYSDWRGMPVAKIRGRYQGGLTSWKILDRYATVYLAHANGAIPDWLIRHEALHVILLSNGIPGHPRKYSKYFERAYWWMPEGDLRRGAFSGEKTIDTSVASCPICGEGLHGLRQLTP